MPLQTEDLVGAAWELGGRGPNYDCAGLAIEVLRRLGRVAPELPVGRDLDPIATVEEFGEAWIRVGAKPLDADKLGDLIVTDPEQNGRSIHVSVVVAVKPRRVLTVVERGGVVRAPAISEAETVGVYRMKPPSATLQGESHA